jgi:hypothetical protein
MLKRTDTYLDRGQGYLFASDMRCRNPNPAGPNHSRAVLLGAGRRPGAPLGWLETLRVKKRIGPLRISN